MSMVRGFAVFIFSRLIILPVSVFSVSACHGISLIDLEVDKLSRCSKLDNNILLSIGL